MLAWAAAAPRNLSARAVDEPTVMRLEGPRSASRLPRKYFGPRWFGRAYATMTRGDSHAPGSVDRQLEKESIGLDSASAPYLYTRYSPPKVAYAQRMRPVLDAIVRGTVLHRGNPETIIRAIAKFTSHLQTYAPRDIDSVIFGGTEEEIIARGSDFCIDVNRVACALFQVAGLPSRLVYLIDTHRAYSGHVITEVYRRGRWGAVDGLTNVVYLTPRGKPATTWDLMTHPEWISRHSRGRSTPFTRRGQFRTAAIVNYRLGRREDHTYTSSPVNRYYRSILELSDRGWPGGLRWLHGEDGAPTLT